MRVVVVVLVTGGKQSQLLLQLQLKFSLDCKFGVEFDNNNMNYSILFFMVAYHRAAALCERKSGGWLRISDISSTLKTQ